MIADPYKIIRKPLLTEKGTILRDEDNVYLFEVDREASRDEIRSAVEKIFQVKVTDVNTLVVRGKTRRVKNRMGKTRNFKKAYVRLAEGNSIDFYQGV
jgi:large subunit ribosomal protein L23